MRFSMKFQSDYCDEDENPIDFYVGRLTQCAYRGPPKNEIYIWAFNEFFSTRFFLVGVEDDLGKTVERAKRLVKILNRKSQKFMVPIDFDDWIEELSENDESEIMCSSKKDNSKFK